jgi:hypothetical protein
MLGNLNGLPHEMRYINEPGNVLNYVPSLPDGAWTDDDTDFEWVYICEMQKARNAYLSPDTIYDLWRERISRRIWASNRFTRHLMDIGIKPPYTAYSPINPWASYNVGGYFLCETFSLIGPAMPQTASRIALNYTTVAVNNEPAQVTQLVATMISTAFIEDDLDVILDAGMAALDEKSLMRQIIRDVQGWHEAYPNDWRKTRSLLKEKYTQDGGSLRDKNGIELNTGAIIAAYLYGQGDMAETMKLAFNLGWDSDCNAATLGTILGVIRGYRGMLNANDRYNPDWQIVDRYRNTTRDNMPMDETITSFADRIIELFEMVNADNGGRKQFDAEAQAMVYQIPAEAPGPVLGLLPYEEQERRIREDLASQLDKDLKSDVREDRARAVFLAICLDESEALAKKYPEAWKQGCHDLSGYWKIISNIFFGKRSFPEIIHFADQFREAGFEPTTQFFGTPELGNDPVYWKDPSELYYDEE